jgi:hypothetical protein
VGAEIGGGGGGALLERNVLCVLRRERERAMHSAQELYTWAEHYHKNVIIREYFVICDEDLVEMFTPP